MNNELKKAILKLKEIKDLLEKFSNRDEAIKFLAKETGISKEECTSAYDFLVKVNLDKKQKAGIFNERFKKISKII